MADRTPEFSDFMRNIQSAELRAVVKLWDICRGRSRFPSWPQLEAQLQVLASERIWGFIYDRSTGEFTARFARNIPIVGFGKSFRGTLLQDLHSPEVFEIARTNFLRVITDPACCRCRGRLFKVEDQIVDGERILLPTGRDGFQPNGVFGASDFDFVVTRTPERLELFHDVGEWYSL